MIRATCVCVIALFAARAFAADEQPLLARPGKLLFEDDFSRGEIGPKWKVGMGFFNIENGVLRGAENPADKHGGFAKTRFEFKDVVAEFSFKFDGSTSFNFTMDDSSYKASHAGHICRVSVYPTQIYLGDMKFGAMKNEVYAKLHDPNTTPAEKKEVQASIKDKSATFKMAIDPAAWHQARVEIVGDEMLVSIDGKTAGYLKSEGIGHPSKNLLGFTILGTSTLLDNVKVWEATASPEWATRRADVVAAIRR
jgi:hypothetical protein